MIDDARPAYEDRDRFGAILLGATEAARGVVAEVEALMDGEQAVETASLVDARAAHVLLGLLTVARQVASMLEVAPAPTTPCSPPAVPSELLR